MENKVSVRGRMARKMVKLANHISPVAEQETKSELREKLLARDWKCPEGLQVMEIERPQFQMELLRVREDDETEGEEGNETDSLVRNDRNPRGVLLQLHGGGYYMDMNNSYRDMAVQYHEVSGGMDVLTIDYRVAPKHPYPAALEDAFDAYKWILEQGYEGKDITFAGDSAGGGLALALCLYVRDCNMPLPKRIITMSAWADLTCGGTSYEENFDIDPVFGGTKDSVVFQNAYYRKDSPENPYISPVFGDYQGFPKMLLQVGEQEMLLSDTITVYEKAKAAGVDVTMHIYPGMFHIFQKGLNMYPESRMAWKEIEEFLSKDV